MAVSVGLSLAAMSRGEWPVVEWRGMTWIEQKAESVVPGDAEVMAGLTTVEGPGVRITIEDASVRKNRTVPVERLIVHERDLMRVRNELFAAGAEAVSINGQRMVANSVIRCVGPSIQINKENTVPPYVIEAVGEPVVLKKSVMMMGGVVDLLSMERLKVNVEQVDALAIAAYQTGCVEASEEVRADD